MIISLIFFFLLIYYFLFYRIFCKERKKRRKKHIQKSFLDDEEEEEIVNEDERLQLPIISYFALVIGYCAIGSLLFNSWEQGAIWFVCFFLNQN